MPPNHHTHTGHTQRQGMVYVFDVSHHAYHERHQPNAPPFRGPRDGGRPEATCCQGNRRRKCKRRRRHKQPHYDRILSALVSLFCSWLFYVTAEAAKKTQAPEVNRTFVVAYSHWFTIDDVARESVFVHRCERLPWRYSFSF